MKRSRIAAGVSFLAVPLGWSLLLSPAVAQEPQYTFTRIADTVLDPGLAGASCVGLNDVGTVVLTFVPDGSATLQLWRGDGVSFTQVAADTTGLCPSINDLDETAYLHANQQTGHVTLRRNAAGAVTTLASSTDSPYLGGGVTYLPSLNNSGHAVFQSLGAPGNNVGAGIYIGPSGASVYNAATDPQLLSWTTASINDTDVVAFVAMRPDASAPFGARIGIYRASATPLIEDGAPVNGGTLSVIFIRPVINSAGTVAFVGSTDGTATVYTTSDGVAVDVVGTGIGSTDRIAINNAGTVAFRKLLGGNGDGIYVGRPGSIDEEVIGPGDPLDGSSFLGGFIWEEGINSVGQVAFYAFLADGRRGIYRANPVDQTPPVVVPPSPVTVPATQADGATGNASPTLAAFLAGGTASDNTDPNPSWLSPQVAGVDVTNASLFPIGTTTVAFRFQDATGNVGTAESTVSVTAQPPPCAMNVTSGASTSQGGARKNKKTGLYSLRVTIRGTSTTPIAGPLSLVLDGLPAGVTLVGGLGTTSCAAPLGSPYQGVPVGADNALSRGERTAVDLTFQNPQNVSIMFTPRLLAGTGLR